MRSSILVLFSNLLGFISGFFNFLTTPGNTNNTFYSFTVEFDFPKGLLVFPYCKTTATTTTAITKELLHFFHRPGYSPRIIVNPFISPFVFTLFLYLLKPAKGDEFFPCNRNKMKHVWNPQCHFISLFIISAFIDCGSHTGCNTFCHYFSSLETLIPFG